MGWSFEFQVSSFECPRCELSSRATSPPRARRGGIPIAVNFSQSVIPTEAFSGVPDGRRFCAWRGERPSRGICGFPFPTTKQPRHLSNEHTEEPRNQKPGNALSLLAASSGL